MSGLQRNVAVIYEVRSKNNLLDKCERKLQMAALDPDDFRIIEAACEQLKEDINNLCWRIGL